MHLMGRESAKSPFCRIDLPVRMRNADEMERKSILDSLFKRPTPLDPIVHLTLK